MYPEMTTLVKNISNLLNKHSQTVSIAESSTGGLISAHLLSVPGASSYFIGGSIIYTRIAQKAFLSINDIQMKDLRASTEKYALLNANQVRKLTGSTWGISETGATGPTGNRYGDNPGHSCIAIAGPVEKTITIETKDNDRTNNMREFSVATLKLLIESIETYNEKSLMNN